MLVYLNIKNILLIDNVEINLGSNFNVFTGETGAGKSVILDCLKLLLGQKSRDIFLQDISHNGYIIAQFDISNNEYVRILLESKDIEFDDDLIIKKVISKNGKIKTYLNDNLVSTAIVAEILFELMEINGQFALNKMNDPKYIYSIVDRYSGISKDISEMKELHNDVSIAYREYSKALVNLEESKEKMERIENIVNEIEALGITSSNEYSILLEKKKDLKNYGIIFSKIKYALQCVERADVSKLKNAEISLIKVNNNLSSDLEKRIKKICLVLESLSIDITECAMDLNAILDDFSSDNDRLEEIDGKIYQLRSVAEKYSIDIDKFHEVIENLEREREMLENINDIIVEKKEIHSKLLIKYHEIAEKISQARHKHAKQLESDMHIHLCDLGLKEAVFRVDIKTDRDSVSLNGYDKIQFLVSFNKGMIPKRVDKIASGGEMARVMLALRISIAKISGVDLIIFDEIDTGVSGLIADKIGLKMKSLSNYLQVLSITHSHQVASCAHMHWKVFKKYDEVKSVSVIDIIELSDEDSRVKEIAKIISNGDIDDEAINLSKKLLASRKK